MASVPVCEVSNCNKVPPPGSVPSKVSEESELDGKDDIEMKNILECSVNCITAQNLLSMCESKAHREFPWVQDLNNIDTKNVILVEAVRVYGKKTSSVGFHGKPVETSLKIKCEGKLVLTFSQPVHEQNVSALKCMITNALVENVKLSVPENLDTNFQFANLYYDRAMSRNITSLKVSLEKFCSVLSIHFPITSDIVLKAHDTMDDPETKKMTEQSEEVRLRINLGERASKDTNYLVYHKHPPDPNGNLNSTKSGDTYGSANHPMNHTMLNAQDKALNPSSHSNDEKQTDSQRNYHKDAKAFPNQHCSSDTHGMRQLGVEENLTNEFAIHGNPHTLESEVKGVAGLVQSSSNSAIKNMHPVLDRTEKPLNTVCDLNHSDCFQDHYTPTFQNQSILTSDTCSNNINDGHSPVEQKGRYTEFCTVREVACDEGCCGLRRKYFGIKSSSKEEKVIILIGNEGSGKTALINLATNFFKGVEDAVNQLYCVIMDQTNEIPHTCSMTAYTFCFAEHDVPITIIDTPGLKDTIETEKNNPLRTLETFFTSNDSNIQLHAIGYVISSNAVGLTLSERHMIEFLFENYGRGISTNFITFVTSVADTSKKYLVSDTFKNHGINSKVVLKFNNTAFSVKEIDDFDRAYWKMGIKSWKRCIKVLKELPPLSIKTLRVEQKQIYSTHLVKTFEDKLKSKLKRLILSFREINRLTQSVQEKSEQVWQSAMALYYLISLSDCSLNYESVLLKYVEEVAGETSFPSKTCVMLLSLCPSRGLLEAGKRMIEFMAPIYTQAKINGLQKTPKGKEPEVLFCKKCDKQHRIEREETKSKKSDIITYHCRDCSCDESEHVKQNKSERSEKKCDISKETCLKHTKNAIEYILGEFSFPGHVLNIKIYLEFVSQNIDEQCKDFIECIMNSRS